LKIALGHKASLALRLLILALMGIIIAFPLLQPALVCGADFPNHLAHAVELDRLWSQGIWYPRWAPDFVFGYGYPAFNYYPPLPRYVVVAVHRLGLPLRNAVNLTMALAFIIAGPTMYLFARSLYGERAGLMAGLAFAFAPYLANDALQRYALNEILALSLMPFVLWTFGRLATTSLDLRRVVVAALACVALVLTHSLMMLMFAPLLLGYLLVLWWSMGRPRALVGQAALAGGLALGLAAFFWWPFVAEVGWVQLWRATILDLTGELLYPLNFLSLRDLLWPKMLWPDYRLGDPLVLRFLSLPQVTLAAVALVMVAKFPRRVRAATILFGLVLLVSVFLVTPASRPVWDNLRAFQIIQFPWRFLAPASLSLALLAGVGTAALSFQISNLKLVVMLDAVLAALLVTWTLPWVRPFTCAVEANPTGSFLLWVDRNHIGGGSGGEFLPRWVDTEPMGSPLEDDLLAGRPLDRLDRASLPEGVQASLVSSRPMDSVWEIRSSQTFTAHFDNFYFPGWSLHVDSVPVPLVLVPSSGLIDARIPAGQHVVQLHLNATPDERLGDLVSLASVIVTFALLVIPRQVPSSHQNDFPDSGMPAWEWQMLVVIGVVMLGIRLILASMAPSGPALPATMSRLDTDLSGEVRLLGYEFSSPTLRAGEPLTVTLYWQAEHILLTSYKTFVHITDANGNLVAQNDAVPANWAKVTTGWLPGQWVADSHQLDIPTAVRGPLTVWVGMYDPATSQRLSPAGDESGRVRLGTLSP
jgi:hypothetical protein